MIFSLQGNTAIHYAVSHGNYEITTALLGTSLVDVNIQNKAGYTPVMLAAICELSNDSERTALRSLIQRADVNMKASNVGFEVKILIQIRSHIVLFSSLFHNHGA